ncbi:TetR/AcrR family transcriptional regulator C-terminal domain-containing protein [Streptomonospora wellingtoniae]|uniref:TetR/AcrR family transcriptional regulator C-terminal domain-containing protein n=1 Tax=Streptomonospora wellingtoniae TaxID=3075544 RepID=A0ABU2KXC4_9ACTN|nr:TetR/AcrR family transcriptional regulator C-terminal domain-containing protein [Streptomonospora sp. DSM 45055]MDT0303903.1 TetR/AcrR family transcriptional regulator C-terminal domain-containing protein [Streptomonospora sp. DSM 45055]
MSRNNAGLSADRIISEALRIIDGQGLRRLTMRRLGDALEVEAMAVYHHFPLGKEQLFDAIVAHISDVTRGRAGADGEEDAGRGEDGGGAADDAEEDLAPAGERPWDERLRDWALDYRRALLDHAQALPLFIHRRPDTEAALRTLELHYAAFTEAGLSGDRVVQAAAALDSYVTGAVIHEVRADGLPAREPAAVDGRFPLAAALEGVRLDPERRFTDGLNALLGSLRP